MAILLAFVIGSTYQLEFISSALKSCPQQLFPSPVIALGKLILDLTALE